MMPRSPRRLWLLMALALSSVTGAEAQTPGGDAAECARHLYEMSLAKHPIGMMLGPAPGGKVVT
jgi:hypothetical protein